MHTIKDKPEDFIVKEITDISIKDSGEYIYFILKKRNYNTLDAMQKMADALHIPISRFGFAGNKDKKALTEQLVSVKDVNKDNLTNLNLNDIEIAVAHLPTTLRGKKRKKGEKKSLI